MREPVNPAANPYAVPLAALEHETRVPPEEQVTEEPSVAAGASAWAWDERRRQAQLAGSA